MKTTQTTTELIKVLRPVISALRQPSIIKRNNRQRRVSFRRSRRSRTVNNPAWGRSLPAAYASHVRPRFNVAARTATTAVVSGCDLVYPLPNLVQAGSDYLFAVIPSNPAYWSGTRIAQFAPAYMNYRPISMTFSYIPQVAVTQQGTVFMGTLWNGAAPSESIQQSLFTSNGGCLTQCYVPCDTQIQLGANLQQNLFTLNGDLNPDTSPFIFLAGIRGANVVPGYFYVTYTYEFKNPIGESWQYGHTGMITAGEISRIPTFANRSAVLLSQVLNFGPGTILDVEVPSSFRYRGSTFSLPPETPLVLYYNQQSGVNAEPLSLSGVITGASYDGTEITLDQMTPVTETTVSVPAGQSLFIRQADGVLRFLRNTTGNAISLATTVGSTIYRFLSTTNEWLSLLNAAKRVIFSIADSNGNDSDNAQALIPPSGPVTIEELN